MRIMLACNAGMSTSLVVAKMQDAAKAQGKDYKIWAIEQGEIQNELGNLMFCCWDRRYATFCVA